MPRYFFHLDDRVTIEDCEGNELPDDAAAVRMANVLAMRLSDHRKFGNWRIIIENENGRQIATVHTSFQWRPSSSARH